jgi:hypothetical protein
MPKPSRTDIRETLLKVIQDLQPKSPRDGSLQQVSVLNHTTDRLGIVNDLDLEQAVLAQWHDLFRTGYLAWGHNLSNASPPFFHVTARGRRALEKVSRDPGNPAGYLKHLQASAKLNSLASSYLLEGLECYVNDLVKSAAVMIGAASESIVLDLRDVLVKRLTKLGLSIPPKLQDWRVKTVLDELHTFLDLQKGKMPRDLREEFDAYWSAFAQQIRAVRNDAGHPTSVDPVSEDTVHASFLVFPELAKLATKLNEWISQEMK